MVGKRTYLGTYRSLLLRLALLRGGAAATLAAAVVRVGARPAAAARLPSDGRARAAASRRRARVRHRLQRRRRDAVRARCQRAPDRPSAAALSTCTRKRTLLE